MCLTLVFMYIQTNRGHSICPSLSFSLCQSRITKTISARPSHPPPHDLYVNVVVTFRPLAVPAAHPSSRPALATGVARMFAYDADAAAGADMEVGRLVHISLIAASPAHWELHSHWRTGTVAESYCPDAAAVEACVLVSAPACD